MLTRSKYENIFEGSRYAFVNPNTNELFKHGELWNDMVFCCYPKQLKGLPRFDPRENFEKKKLKKKFDFSRTNENPNLLKNLAYKLVKDSKYRSKLHGGISTLEPSKILDILKLGYCQGSFPPLPFVFDKPNSAYSPSLDRINSQNRNYTPDNVRVVCRGINTARLNYDDSDAINICERLSGFLRRRRNSV